METNQRNKQEIHYEQKTTNEAKKANSFSEAWAALKTSPYQLYIIFLLKFLESYSYFAIIYTLIIFLSDEFKYTDEQAGWCYGLFGMCTSIYGFMFGGYLIDSLGVRLSLIIGSFVLLIGRLLLVISTEHFHVLLILYTILPIGTCMGIPVMQIAIRRYTNEKSRSLAFSIFYGMMNISAIFSASAIDYFRFYVVSLNNRSVNILNILIFELTPYRALFLSGACTTLVSFIICFSCLTNVTEPESNLKVSENHSHSLDNGAVVTNTNRSTNLYNTETVNIHPRYSYNISRSTNTNDYNLDHTEENHRFISSENNNHPVIKQKNIKINPGPLEVIKEVTSQKSFWKFVCLIILLMGVRIVYRHLDATFPKYMVREFGKEVNYGSLIAINPFLVVIILPLFAPLSYIFSAYTQIMIGAFITSLSPFFLVSGPHLWSSIMFVIILSIGEALWSPRLYEYTIAITEAGREGIYMALASSPMFIATLITGATSGMMLEKFCPEKGHKESYKMWLIIGCTTIISPILLFIYKNKIEISEVELQQEKEIKNRKKDKTKKGYNTNGSIIIDYNNIESNGRNRSFNIRDTNQSTIYCLEKQNDISFEIKKTV